MEHFRRGLPAFAEGLSNGQVAIHSVVIGELATGNLLRRDETLSWLGRLPRLPESSLEDCLLFIERHKLFGVGIGWSDIQLLAAAAHAHATLWSFDKKLGQAARKLQLA